MVSFQLGYAHFEILKQKINGWGLFELLEIHRCPEGAKLGFKKLIILFGGLIVLF